MESKKLSVLEKQLPLRAYPPEDLNKILIMDFLPWLSGLLSLTDEVSANRLELALPAIKDQCIGMGFVEIKKMFEMYADNKLAVKPISNFFDRILLGKIIDEYRSYKKRTVKPKIEEMKPPPGIDLSEQIEESIKEMQEYYYQHGKINGIVTHLYSHLFSKGVLPQHNKEFVAKITSKSLKIAKSEAMSEAKMSINKHRDLKKVLLDLESAGNPVIKVIAKRVTRSLRRIKGFYY